MGFVHLHHRQTIEIAGICEIGAWHKSFFRIFLIVSAYYRMAWSYCADAMQPNSSKWATRARFDSLKKIWRSCVEIDEGDGEFRMDDIEDLQIKNEIDQIMQNVDNIMQTIETIYPQKEEESNQEEN